MNPSIESRLRQSVLILKYLNEELTESESAELNAWIKADPAHEQLFQELTNESEIRKELAIMDAFSVEEAKQAFLNKLKPVPMKRRNLKWYYAAASVVVLLALGLLLRNSSPEKEAPLNIVEELKKAELITPATDKAILTMADGQKIEISPSTSGLISKQDKVDLVAEDGEIRYNVQGAVDKMQYNTLTTPKGGQYKLVLEDGTKLWINAASSITFPVAFIGNERKVVLHGEGYFEVAPDAKRPFRVEMDHGMVEAIGTAFNVNSYEDDPISKTTLIEGKVRVQSNKEDIILIPGQQANISTAGDIKKITDVDTDAELAWKNGQFVFKSATVPEIMKQLSRWYDIDVKFQQESPKDKFSGIVNRSGNLSEVLRILNEGGIRFKINNRTIIIF